MKTSKEKAELSRIIATGSTILVDMTTKILKLQDEDVKKSQLYKVEILLNVNNTAEKLFFENIELLEKIAVLESEKIALARELTKTKELLKFEEP
jgi:hypothetical protein